MNCVSCPSCAHCSRKAVGLFDDDAGLFGLGDVACTRSEAETGIAQVSRLATFWERAKKDPAVAAKYSSTVESILRRFQALAARMDDTSSSAAAIGPWCDMKALGAEAEEATNSLAVASGQAAPPKLAPKGLLDNLGAVLAGLALLIGGGVAVSLVAPALRRRAHEDR